MTASDAAARMATVGGMVGFCITPIAVGDGAVTLSSQECT